MGRTADCCPGTEDYKLVDAELHGILMDLNNSPRMMILMMIMMMMMMRGTGGRPHLVAGLAEGRGLAQVMAADAAPWRPVVGDALTGPDVLVVQDVAVVIQDATACQLAAAPPRARPNHLTVQGHHHGGTQARRAPPTGRRTGLREAAVHLPVLTEGVRGSSRGRQEFGCSGRVQDRWTVVTGLSDQFVRPQ